MYAFPDIFQVVQWAGLESLAGQLWPLGLMFDIK